MGTTKVVILYKMSLNIYGPCYYELNTINKKNINLPRYGYNPKNIELAKMHVSCVVLLDGLKAHGHGAVNYLDWGWAQVGQVNLL